MSAPAAAPAAAPVDAQSLLNTINEIKSNQESLAQKLADLSKPADPAARKGVPGGAPAARSGEDIMGSRGFQFSRVIGALVGKMDKGFVKIEAELSNRIQKEYVERGFYTKDSNSGVIVPLSSALMFGTDPSLETLSKEIHDMTAAGVAGADPEEVDQISRRSYGRPSQFAGVARTKALSWQDESGLGNLVGPAVMGEPIELLRNQEIFMKAGARTLPFPPSGRITWPRFTGATTAYWVGTTENNRTIIDSDVKTGDVVLQVKKLGVLVKVPNELFRFPTVSVEQVLREDMMKQAALKLDKTFLDAVGDQLTPKGLINYSNILSYTAGTVGANGNTLEPEDILKIIGTVEEQNVEFNAWMMRPLMYSAIGNRRGDAVNTGDKKGSFLFNVLRTFQENYADATNNTVGQLEGYPVFKTNQVVNTRAKGSATNLSYILGGQFQQYMIALSGVMEFAVTTQGDTPFQTDQSWIRLITWADGAPRHEEAFILVDNLIVG